MAKVGRNDPCPCGSGKKYKKCCLLNEVSSVASYTWLKMRRTEGELIPTLLKHATKFYGEDALVEAWDEFSLWRDVPLDPSAHPELDTAFLPWFVFNWIPDNAEEEQIDHLPEMSVAMHYLRHKGSRLDPFHQRFIEEICEQQYSFFMVTDKKSGESLTLRDLILDREVTVHERQASSALTKASIIFTRIVTMDEASIMVGCAPTVIPQMYHNDFIDFREEMAQHFPNLDQEVLFEYDFELRTMYYDIQEALVSPVLPQLHNTDGDEMQFTTLSYTLICSARQAFDALFPLSLEENPDVFLQDGNFNEAGELISIEFPWLKAGNNQQVSWENTVFGHMVIDGSLLTIEVNSQERADMTKLEIAARLGAQASFRHAVIESSEKMLEDMAAEPAAALTTQNPEEELIGPEMEEMLKEMGKKHWRAWLDMSIPALNDQTPREAVKTATGRERLEALLWEFEGKNDAQQSFAPDVNALRQELGLDSIE